MDQGKFRVVWRIYAIFLLILSSCSSPTSPSPTATEAVMDQQFLVLSPSNGEGAIVTPTKEAPFIRPLFDRPEAGLTESAQTRPPEPQASRNPNIEVIPQEQQDSAPQKSVQSSATSSFGVKLQCLNDYCSDTSISDTLVETFDISNNYQWTWVPDTFDFSVICETMFFGCAQKDIYYHTKLEYEFGANWVNAITGDRQVSLLAGSRFGLFSGWLGYPGTGIRANLYCDSGRHGHCTHETWGVIAGDKIHPTGQTGIFISTPHAQGATGDLVHRKMTVTVSLDPGAIALENPEESSYCNNCDDSQKYVADPINTRTGIFSYPVTDLSFNTLAGELAFNRIYVSGARSRYANILGTGWTTNHDIRLVFPDEPEGTPGFVLFKHPSGNFYRFWDIGNRTGIAAYRPYAGVKAQLIKNTDSTYTLTDSSHVVYAFNASGKIISISNSQGYTWIYTYTPDGLLNKVSADNLARYLDFS